MAIKPITKMGNPVLRTPARPITVFNTTELNQLTEDLWDSMAAASGIGIAAPQIGVDLQVAVFGFDHNPRRPYVKGVPKTVIINPTIEPLSDETNEDWEGCLSLMVGEQCRFCGLVPRYTHIRYHAYDAQGQSFSQEVHGFHARIVQHEVDHLNGKLFPYRIKNFDYFGFADEMQELIKTVGDKLS